MVLLEWLMEAVQPPGSRTYVDEPLDLLGRFGFKDLTQSKVIRAIVSNLGIASQSEVIRAIVSGYSPCCGVPHLWPSVGVH